MYKTIGIVVVLVLLSAFSISATVLAGGKPSSGSVVTFDSGTLTSFDTYVEDGVTIKSGTGDPLSSDIKDHDGDGDKEIGFNGEDQQFLIVNLGGATFDLTSLNIEALDATLTIRSDTGDVISITSKGAVTLNLTGITSARILFVGSFGAAVIDDIVINGGGGNGQKGNKAYKVDVCHVGNGGSAKVISVNGNALDAHLNHGDSVPVEDGQGDRICE